jgi:hypothetical protein
MAKYSTKKRAWCFRQLLVERVQDRMAGAVRGGARTVGHIALGIFGRVPAKASLIDRPGLGAAERHAEMLELDDRQDRLAAHVFDCVLIAEPVGAPDRVEHVPAPIVLFHVAERGADAALRRDRVTAGRENFGDARRVQPRRDHAQCRAQAGAARAENDDVERVVDDVVAVCLALFSSLPAEEELEDGEHAGTAENDRGGSDEELGRD